MNNQTGYFGFDQINSSAVRQVGKSSFAHSFLGMRYECESFYSNQTLGCEALAGAEVSAGGHL